MTADQLSKVSAANEKLKAIHSQIERFLDHRMRHRPLSSAAMRTSPRPISPRRSRGRGPEIQRQSATLIELYQGRVGRFVLSMLGNDPDWEDVAQVTFVKMMLGIERLQSVEIFESWLFKIARNSSLDHLRRRRWRRLFMSWEPHHGGSPRPARGFEDARLAQVERALILTARRSARTDTADARERLELRRPRAHNRRTPAAVKSRLFRARSRLRALISKGDES